MAHAWQGLGRFLRVQMLIGLVGLTALVADHAQRYYPGSSTGRDDLVPWIVRVLVGLLFVTGLLAARLARSFLLGGSDESFLTATPIAARSRFRYRAWQLALGLLPVAALGTGAFLPLAWMGDPGLLVRAWILWLAWCACVWAWSAGAAALAPPPGRGQAAFELALGTVPAGLVIGARFAASQVMPLTDRDSLWVTAAIGLVLAVGFAWAAPRVPGLLARRERTLEWIRVHGERLQRARAGRRRGSPAAWARGSLALVARNARLARRNPRVAGPWLAGLACKALGLALVVVPMVLPAWGLGAGLPPAEPPWAFAGALLVLGDAVLAGALIAQMEWESPVLFFSAPVTRVRQWWGLAGPALILSAACALTLAGLAAVHPSGGIDTARFILAWCGLAGPSLLATGTNLALASFPQPAVAQNLFWAGLLVCLVLSGVIPLFGWVVLLAFALFSFRQLRHWGPE